MKRLLKICLSVILSSLILFSVLLPSYGADNSGTMPGWLHTEGESILDAGGRAVILRGTNFGGWGIMEDWFCPFTDPAGVDNAYQTLVKRFGLEAAHELFKIYRSNWITETDFRNVAEAGMNVIRLPIWYRNLQKDDNGTWYRNPDGTIDFSEIDGIVDLCRKYGLYLILDMHGLPGYQNDYDHCGRSKSMSLFDDSAKGERYRSVTLDLWTEIARHYADEPVIAMYDLMNEPLGTNITREKSLQQNFWDFSDRLYKAVRAVDSRHIICMEAIWDPSAIPGPDKYGWTNIVYQEHLYDVTNPSVLRKVNEIRDAGYNSPFYIGEFYPRGLSSFDYIISLFNQRSLSWTTWTYKGAGQNADESPWFFYGAAGLQKIDYVNDSYDVILEKWGSCLKTDSGEFKRTAFADYVSNYTDGAVDNVSLYSFGAANSLGTFRQRYALFVDKLKAIYTTILDWLRKLKTGDLL